MTAPYVLRAEVPAEIRIERSVVHYDVGESIPAELVAAARAVVDAGDFCNCVICGGGPVRCQFETPSPLEWPAQSDAELESSIRRQVEGDRWMGINDESEVERGE